MGLGLVVEDESSDMYIGHSEHSLLCNIYDKSSCIGLICFARGIDFYHTVSTYQLPLIPHMVVTHDS